MIFFFKTFYFNWGFCKGHSNSSGQYITFVEACNYLDKATNFLRAEVCGGNYLQQQQQLSLLILQQQIVKRWRVLEAGTWKLVWGIPFDFFILFFLNWVLFWITYQFIHLAKFLFIFIKIKSTSDKSEVLQLYKHVCSNIASDLSPPVSRDGISTISTLTV